VGVALIDRKVGKDPQVQELITAIKAGKGGTVSSRLPDSFEGIMRFVLAVVVERGETTREDIASAYTRTLAYHADPRPVHFDRSFEEDMMEDLPAYRKVVEAGGSIHLTAHHLSPAGVHATIASGDKKYEVSLAVIAISCTCPAASQFYRGRICKHQACAIHDLLFGKGITTEVRHRTVYICGHVFSRTLDPGTLLAQALEVLTAWGLIERVPSGWRATPLGDVASASGFDLLLVHQAATRVADARADCCRDVAHWAIADYIAEEKDQARWCRAIDDWLDEVDAHEIKLPTKYRGDFERRLEDLARVCLLYEKAAEALGKHEIGQVAHAASGAVRYGVAPELVPLMALGLPQLARGRSRYLHERGIKNVQDLASADPPRLADPRRAPEALVKGWVTRAKEIFTARAVASADREEAEQEFDELVARFRLDPAALA
jgi:hypothetical protein